MIGLKKGKGGVRGEPLESDELSIGYKLNERTLNLSILRCVRYDNYIYIQAQEEEKKVEHNENKGSHSIPPPSPSPSPPPLITIIPLQCQNSCCVSCTQFNEQILHPLLSSPLLSTQNDVENKHKLRDIFDIDGAFGLKLHPYTSVQCRYDDEKEEVDNDQSLKGHYRPSRCVLLWCYPTLQHYEDRQRIAMMKRAKSESMKNSGHDVNDDISSTTLLYELIRINSDSSKKNKNKKDMSDGPEYPLKRQRNDENSVFIENAPKFDLDLDLDADLSSGSVSSSTSSSLRDRYPSTWCLETAVNRRKGIQPNKEVVRTSDLAKNKKMTPFSNSQSSLSGNKTQDMNRDNLIDDKPKDGHHEANQNRNNSTNRGLSNLVPFQSSDLVEEGEGGEEDESGGFFTSSNRMGNKNATIDRHGQNQRREGGIESVENSEAKDEEGKDESEKIQNDAFGYSSSIDEIEMKHLKDKDQINSHALVKPDVSMTNDRQSKGSVIAKSKSNPVVLHCDFSILVRALSSSSNEEKKNKRGGDTKHNKDTYQHLQLYPVNDQQLQQQLLNAPLYEPKWCGRFHVIIHDVQLYPPNKVIPYYHIQFLLSENPIAHSANVANASYITNESSSSKASSTSTKPSGYSASASTTSFEEASRRAMQQIGYNATFTASGSSGSSGSPQRLMCIASYRMFQRYLGGISNHTLALIMQQQQQQNVPAASHAHKRDNENTSQSAANTKLSQLQLQIKERIGQLRHIFISKSCLADLLIVQHQEKDKHHPEQQKPSSPSIAYPKSLIYALGIADSLLSEEEIQHAMHTVQGGR